MTIAKLRLGFQGLSFLDAVSARPERSVRLTRAPAPHLLVWAPDDLAELFRSERDMYLKPSDTLRPLVGPTSVLFANGTRHDAYRQVIGPALRGRRLARHIPAIRTIAEQAGDELAGRASFVVPEWARRVTLRVIGHILLGDGNSAVLGRVGDLVEQILGSPWRTVRHRYLRPPAPVPSRWGAFLRDRDALGEELTGLCPRPASDARVPAPGPVRDVPSLAAELASGEPPLGPLGGDEFADQLISLIFAGHETTASAIAWTLYWLAAHDGVRANLGAELAACSSDGSSAADLPLLDAVCRESLRITPPAVLAGNRTLTTDRELLGRGWSRGTTLTPCVYAAHRQPDLYPGPERFDPGRFLGRKWPGQHYLPFGGGTRRCLGADLALLEMRMVVAAVLRRVELGRPGPRDGVPHRRGPAMGPPPALTLALGPHPRPRPRPCP
ncbi:cytochrome P450 [Streptomyces yaizuensis]|uniref:Cytochrome P450 n=1 Tax=Streptomyces yaizuensis TaxID=2989713 RepID=A0ABQ5NXE7_9ACTN|nr:cytochrome P450 [Streptomyces sp. YSPA8]GLF95042.1 cytochrome P450 [Streptomyces sp. YSPA8]